VLKRVTFLEYFRDGKRSVLFSCYLFRHYMNNKSTSK